jgi:hypothetical protein
MNEIRPSKNLTVNLQHSYQYIVSLDQGRIKGRSSLGSSSGALSGTQVKGTQTILN